ncbi:MAG: hypothetical protein ACR2NA_07860 [Solirubrobacterales bacterium]
MSEPNQTAKDPVRAIADAVLYEGYVLFPYRRSALKNQQRFTWGGVYPVGWPEGPARLRTECLLEGDPADVEVTARFLQVVDRAVQDPDGLPVDELTVDGERYLTWEEAVEREIAVSAVPGRTPVEIEAASEREQLAGGAGALMRSHRALHGVIETSVTELEPGLHRIGVEVANAASWDGDRRDDVLKDTLCSTHVVLRTGAGAFVSLTDPPADRREHAEACDNEGLWPVLAAERGDHTTILASPIILEDHPRIAPESPGDLFDGGEVDQLLTLTILAMTDAEKAEMRATDPRAREILERTEAMDGDDLMRLHGTIRDMGPAHR